MQRQAIERHRQATDIAYGNLVTRISNKMLHAVTWCRVCGDPVLLQVVPKYRDALDGFEVFDHMPMVHGLTEETKHSEVNGGWGIHWRLDEVLYILFPEEHEDEEFWPRANWYEHRKGDDDREVVQVPQDFVLKKRPLYRADELVNLEQDINEATLDGVTLDEWWTASELEDEFQVLAFKPPFVAVRNWETGEVGTMMYRDSPRVYFDFSMERMI